MNPLPLLAFATFAVWAALRSTPVFQSGGSAMPSTIKTISQRGRDFIKRLEGYSAVAYPDGGYYSIGYGHQIRPGDGVTRYNRLSVSDANDLFDRDIASFEAAVFRLVNVPLTQSQFDALVSFVYNVGVNAFQTSTMRQKLNARDYAGAANEFARWNKSEGRVLSALVSRRSQEKAIFNGG